MEDRNKIQKRIIQIISYIDSDEVLKPIIKNLKLFSTEDLYKLLEFLETWNYKPIYILLDEKIKQYLWIIKEIKQIKIWEKIKKFKNIERKEKIKENISIEGMLVF